MNTLRRIPALSARGARVPSLCDGGIDGATLHGAGDFQLAVAAT